jgi:drug/metabolite transporter (DMT)-like permease
VVLAAQAVGLVGAVTFALVTSQPVPGPESLAWAAAAGVSGIVALAAFYQALAIGRMGIVAPVAGVLGASIPVVVGIAGEGLPSALQAIGIVLAVASVALVSRPGDQPAGPSDRRALLLAIAAGIGFALFITFMARAGSASVPWLVSSSRASAVALMTVVVLVTRTRAAPGPRGWLAIAAIAGVFDVVGNGLFVAAVQTGRLDIAAVTSSLYPIATVILARVILGERFAHVHVVGIAVATAAIVCIAVG